MEELSFITAQHAALVPLVVGLTEVVKNFINLQKYNKFIPLIAIVIGILLSILVTPATIFTIIGSGIFIGLTASGLYSAGSTIKNG